MGGRLTAVGAVILAIGAVAWAVQEPILHAAWDYRARAPLTAEEATVLAACEDPGWTALTKVVEQGLALGCGEAWLTRTLGEERGDRELQWLAEVARDPARAPVQRLRAAGGLLAAGHPPVADLPFLATDASLPPAVREGWIEMLREGDVPRTWADPLLRDQAALRDFDEGVDEELDLVLRDLRLAAIGVTPRGGGDRAARVERLLDEAGLGGGRLERALERRARGLPGQLPRGLQGMVLERGAACTDRASTDCLLFVADLTERARNVPDEDEPPRVALPLPLWEVRYPDRPAGRLAAAEALGAVAAWIAAAEGGDRADRLLGAVAWPGTGYGVEEARSGRMGDPLHVLPLRGGAPWTTALAFLSLAEAAGLDGAVSVQGDRVVLSVGARRVAVGPCGAVSEAEAAGAAWPARAVMAQAALEGAGAALRSGEVDRALRLAAFAERLDQVGAAGAVDAVRAVGAAALAAPDVAAGAAAGALLVSTGPVPQGAGAEREARPAAWADAVEQWRTASVPTACPAVLGP